MKRKARQLEGFTGLDFSDETIPEELNKYVDYSLAISKYIASFVESNAFRQRDIAEKLNKSESEISKWLNGFHNLTLKSIIKLESVSDIHLLNPAILACANFKNEHSRELISSKIFPTIAEEKLDSFQKILDKAIKESKNAQSPVSSVLKSAA